MLKRMNKKLALVLVLTMLATMFVGVGTASAKSLNSVNKVVSVGEDFDGDTGVVLTLQEDELYITHFVYGDTFEVVLPSGVKWNAAATTVTGPATAVKTTDQVLEVTMTDAVTDADVDEIGIPIDIEIDGYTGDIKAEIDPLDSGVTGGEYLVARVAGGKMTASVDSVKKIAKSNTNGGTIQLREAAMGAVGNGECEVTIKLPANFEWWDTPDVTGAGGFADAVIDTSAGPDGRTFTFTFDPTARTQRGTLYITTPIKAGRDAGFGEVEVAISGENADGDIVDADLVVGEYVDWGITTKIAEVKDLTSGKFDQVTGKITIKENIIATLIGGRDLTLEVPSWVKVTDVKSLTESNINVTASTIDGKKSYVDFTITDPSTTSKGEITFKLELSIQGDQEGDIEATLKGAGVEETTLLIAKAVKPVNATCEATTDVNIGVQDQAVADVVITEGIKEAIRKDTLDDMDGAAGDDGQIVLSLTEGATFADTPTVAITEGNMEIKADDVRLGDDSTTVVIPVKSEGSKITSIKVSDILLTLDRTIPEGDLWFKVGGNAVVENSRAAGDADLIEGGEFKTSTAAKVVIANVVTPAPGEEHATAIYTIGSIDYSINGAAQTAMDVAPYIKGDRTYMPIRYVAYALGIDDNNIVWDDVNKTVTLMKGDKVVQLKIGSTTLLVNGVAITMDVAPEITSSRTMLPIRFVAQAFGAEVGWDAATQQVSVTL